MSPLWYIIVNPASGNGAAAQRWPQMERVLQELSFSYTVQFTERPGHALRLVEDAVLKGYRHIMAVGGDGSNHEAVNGIMRQTVVPSADIVYALMPVGTGNDWARMYRIPQQIRARLMRLKNPEIRLQDIGLAQYTLDGQTLDRYFVNVAGMAYDGYVGYQMSQKPRPVKSRLQYLWLVTKYLMDYKLLPARISFDDRIVEDHFYTINIGLCKYSGGGMQFVPQAVPDDGLFALTFARSVPKWDVLLQTPRFYRGTILNHPRIEGFQTAALSVDSMEGRPTLLEADGEFLGETPARFTIIEKALRFAL